MVDKTAGTLNRLIAVCRDGEEFYASAAEKVRDDRLRETFRETSAMHREIGSELRPHVARTGGSPAEGGTVGGKVRQLYTALKASFASDTEQTLLADLEEVEEAVLATFRGALDEPIQDDVRTLIAGKVEVLQAARDRVKALQKA